MSKVFKLDPEAAHFSRVDRYARQVEQLYLEAIQEAVSIGSTISLPEGSDQFTFDQYPQTKARIDKLMKTMSQKMTFIINEATGKEWYEAVANKASLIDSFIKKTQLTKSQLESYNSRNLEALQAFQNRKIGGLNLSEKVWKYTSQFKGDLEMALDIGIGDGRSAAELSRDVRSYLNEPEKLFRRVRDKHGVLQLSKNAKKYHPGAGQYRSSYKNAMRMTRTTINMAYRESDYLKNQQLDFVVGFKVVRSNHEFDCSVCNALKGNYPKTFKFVGWHPHCRCHIEDILASEEEFINHQKGILAGNEIELKSKNEVSDVPANFKQWIKDNQERIDNAKSKPYFIGDNPQFAKVAKQYKSNLAGLEPEYARRVEKRIDELLVEYPSDEMKLLSVHENEQNIGYWNSIENRMSINKDYDLLKLEQSAISSKNTNWTIQGSDPVKSLVDHEFGHTLTSKHIHTKTEIGEKIEGVYKKHMDFLEKGVHPEVTKAEFEADEFYRIIEAGIESKKIRYQTLRKSGATDDIVWKARDEWRQAEKLGDFDLYNDDGEGSKLMRKASEMRRKYPKSHKNEYGITVYPDWILESEFYVSRYSLTNAHEFAAECFAMYLNSERQSIYVKEIIDIIKRIK